MIDRLMGYFRLKYAGDRERLLALLSRRSMGSVDGMGTCGLNNCLARGVGDVVVLLIRARDGAVQSILSTVP